MEVLFKNISKSFQALVQELTPDEIERMMWSLKQEKEELVRIRTAIPQKTYLATQVRVDFFSFFFSFYIVKMGLSFFEA